VDEIAALTTPGQVHWCDGSAEEYDRLARSSSTPGPSPASRRQAPQQLLGRLDPGDVARVEDRTFICSKTRDEAGPTNNWRTPTRCGKLLGGLFAGSMKGRTMYVVPFSMGPLGSPIAHIGVELTDSPYVAVSMRIMTRMGAKALDALGPDGSSSLPPLGGSPARARPGRLTVALQPRQQVHRPLPRRPGDLSYGSGYGGNALSGRSASPAHRLVMARDDGWLAEHMLI